MNNIPNFIELLRRKPDAVSRIKGSDDYSDIGGTVRFYQTRLGVIVVAQISGLPVNYDICAKQIFAFHIHSGDECSGNATDPFANAKMHYNPHDCLHPYHAGDLPPLFACNGYAFSMFLTDRFSVREIVGKTIIIHSGVDDFKTQPSGNSGNKIACGIIEKLRN